MSSPARLRCLCLSTLLAAGLAACGEAPRPPASGDAPVPAGDAQLAWQGVVACADCAGIDTRLRLERSGKDARYQLVEAFLDADGAEYFREEGRWERVGKVLVLHAAGGGVRRYRIGVDGSLLVTDRAGRDVAAGSALAPVPGPAPGL